MRTVQYKVDPPGKKQICEIQKYQRNKFANIQIQKLTTMFIVELYNNI